MDTRAVDLPADTVLDRVPPAPPAPTPPTGERAEWLRAARYSLLVLVVVRAGLSLVGLLATAVLPRGNAVDVPGWPATQPSHSWHHLVTAFERQDALWYLRIASKGYRADDGSAAFFPLYPLLVRAVGVVTGGHWLLAAFLVTHVALLAGLTLLYRLTVLELGEATARRAVLYLCLFPTGYFLFAPYTESLFLAVTVGALYAARRQAWGIAAVLALAAGLSRSQGVLLAAPLAVEGLLQARAVAGTVRARLGRLAQAALAAVAPLVALGVVALMWQHLAGDWRRPFDIQKSGWGKEASWPWTTLWRGFQEGTKYFGSYPGGYHTADLVLVGLALVCGVWVALRLRATWSVYYWLSLVFPMTLMYGGRPLLSIPRFLVVLFPLVWALARFSERWKAHDAVVAASAAGLGLLSALFVGWYPMF